MDKLENIIKQNLQESELPEGHEIRFAKRLKKEYPRKGVILKYIIGSSVAAVLLLAIFTQKPDKGDTYNTELVELIEYCDYKIYTLENDILTSIHGKVDKEEFNRIKNDLSQTIAYYENLKESKDNISSERFKYLLCKSVDITNNLVTQFNNI